MNQNLIQRLKTQEQLNQIDTIVQAMEINRTQTLQEIQNIEAMLMEKYSNLDKIYAAIAQQNEMRTRTREGKA